VIGEPVIGGGCKVVNSVAMGLDAKAESTDYPITDHRICYYKNQAV
jgi:hypothetical protein